jgi:tRNA pseudouridine55 synthase
VSTENSKFKDFNFAEGELLLINKPYKWTSFDVVGKIRNSLKPLKLKVGHAGTLDPLATGLLIICTGKLTKQIDTFQAEEKEYTGTMILGATILLSIWKRRLIRLLISLPLPKSRFMLQ